MPIGWHAIFAATGFGLTDFWEVSDRALFLSPCPWSLSGGGRRLVTRYPSVHELEALGHRTGFDIS